MKKQENVTAGFAMGTRADTEECVLGAPADANKGGADLSRNLI
jgi:hypothetical protein